MTEKTFSAKQIASRIGADPKTLRKFFRSPKSGYEAVGQGGRYEFPQSQLTKIREDFERWQSGKRSTAPRPTTPKLTPEVQRTFQKLDEREKNGSPASKLLARFPLIPGESVEQRTRRVGAILAKERIAEGKCPMCQHSIDEHHESKFMQHSRPRSSAGKMGCTHLGCWCRKLPQAAIDSQHSSPE